MELLLLYMQRISSTLQSRYLQRSLRVCALIGLLYFGIINLLKPRAKISSILAKKEISRKILSFVRLALEKTKEKKYNTRECE